MKTKDKVLSVAAKLFMESGYNKTTTRQIAARAGISRGNLQYYFNKKEDLLLYLFKDLSDSIRDSLSSLSWLDFANAAPLLKYAADERLFLETLNQSDGLFRVFTEAANIEKLRSEYTKISQAAFLEVIGPFRKNFSQKRIKIAGLIAKSSEMELLNRYYRKRIDLSIQEIGSWLIDSMLLLLGVKKKETENIIQNSLLIIQKYSAADVLKVIPFYGESA
jgi:AcrR family transcriptional regulator